MIAEVKYWTNEAGTSKQVAINSDGCVVIKMVILSKILLFLLLLFSYTFYRSDIGFALFCFVLYFVKTTKAILLFPHRHFHYEAAKDLN